MSSPAHHRMLYRAVFWGMCLGIFVLAMLPKNSSSIAFPYADKIVHAMAFMGLGFIGGVAYPARILVLAFFLVLLGAAIEVAQGFTPDRSPELFDFFADVVGIALGFITYCLSERSFLRK